MFASATASAHEGQQANYAWSSPIAEAFIHTPPGSDKAGDPPEAETEHAATLRVRVLDEATGDPTFCRVAIRDSEGRYYEPSDNALSPWSLHRLGNRVEKGPFRYFGWFFYSDGTFDVRVPEGEIYVEAWKGFEFRPVTRKQAVRLGARNAVEIRLERTADMASRGWYSGDTHIHLDRRTEQEEARALDLIAAEDIRFGYLLAMNDTKTYTGEMATQEWQQLRGMGRNSIARRDIYALSSGQEYRCSTYGHICLLLADDMVLRGQTVNPNEWPLFDHVGAETRALGGVAFHAHGGYEKEIYADFVHGNTDGVELLQFAVYRGIGLTGWYHMLNAGYRFPAVGGSDYPYCRALGDCRTYAKLEGTVSVEAWTKAVAEGRSFFTTGPLLEFSVNGVEPGETIEVAEGESTVRVHLSVTSEVAPATRADIIANGKVAKSFECSGALPQSERFEVELPIDSSTWVAARVYGEQLAGFPDAEAHTNPVYLIRDGAPIRSAASTRWLIERVDGRMRANAERTFERREDVLAFFAKTKALLQLRLEAAQTP